MFSPRGAARAAGFFYLLIIASAIFAEPYVRGSLIDSGDAATTAANILANEPLYKLAAAADFVTLISDIAVAGIFYVLLAPAGRAMSMVAALSRLAMTAVMAVNIVFFLAPLALLKDAPWLAPFGAGEREALSLLSLKMHSIGYNVALILFAAHCVLAGVLMTRATFLPRIFGLLFVVAGVCYATNGLVHLVLPPLPIELFPWILLPAIPAEWGLALWLLLVGVNTRKWREQAEAAHA